MSWEIRQGDCLSLLRAMPDKLVQTVVTSPPYWGLRDYGTATWDGGDAGCDHAAPRGGGPVSSSTLGPPGQQGGEWHETTFQATGKQYRDACGKCGARRIDSQLGLEPTPDEYVQNLVEVFREVKRVLRPDGTVWCNLGDSFMPGKQLAGVPWRVAFALQADGWYLRSDIIWAKPNPMPESVTDRPTRSHEYIFLLSKSARYFFDQDAIREPHSREWFEESVGPPYMTALDGRNDGGKRQGTGDPAGRNKRSVWTVATQPFSAKSLGISRQVRVAPDEVGGDTKRKLSPDCPVHAGRSDRAATAPGGGRASDESSRSVDSDARHVQGQLGGPESIDPTPALDSASDGLGSPLLAGSQTAMPHSTGSHKTASETASDGMASEGTTDRIEGSQRSHETPERDDSDNPESSETDDHKPRKSGLTGGAYSPPGQTPHGNARVDSACTCEYYRLEEPDHFATFPPKLIEPCILAGSAPKACGKCGAPWERVTEHGAIQSRGGSSTSSRNNHMDVISPLGQDPLKSAYNAGAFVQREHVTTGWQPTCTHSDDSGQSLVLDPFCGSGTTGMVALRHDRSFIGLELNPEYVEMARWRIRDDAPLLNSGLES